MKKYRVQFARTTWLTAFVEAEDEDQALELGFDELPPVTAYETGWGSMGKWSAEVGEWEYLDEFYGREYSEEAFGPVVEEIEE